MEWEEGIGSGNAEGAAAATSASKGRKAQKKRGMVEQATRLRDYALVSDVVT